MAQLSERLRQLRKQRGMTQKDLEARSGVPQNTISRIEIGGVQEISTKTLIGLARALQVSTDCLLGLDELETAEAATPAGAQPARLTGTQPPTAKARRQRKTSPVA